MRYSGSMSCFIKGVLITIAWLGLLFGMCVCMDPRWKIERVAEEAHEAVTTRDAKALLALTSPGEIESLGLTEEKLDRLLNGYVLRDTGALTVAPHQEHFENDFPSVQFAIQRDYLTSDGRPIRFHFSVMDRDDGKWVDDVVASLVYARASLEGKEMVDLVERDVALLDATGIKGIYSGDMYLNWLNYVAEQRDF